MAETVTKASGLTGRSPLAASDRGRWTTYLIACLLAVAAASVTSGPASAGPYAYSIEPLGPEFVSDGSNIFGSTGPLINDAGVVLGMTTGSNDWVTGLVSRSPNRVNAGELGPPEPVVDIQSLFEGQSYPNLEYVNAGSIAELDWDGTILGTGVMAGGEGVPLMQGFSYGTRDGSTSFTPATVASSTGAWNPTGLSHYVSNPTFLGNDSYLYSRNKSNQLVGYQSGRAILCNGYGSPTDLNSLIDPLEGWTLTKATDINSRGQIVGVGTRGGVSQAFLMTPKTLHFFGIGVNWAGGKLKGQIDAQNCATACRNNLASFSDDIEVPLTDMDASPKATISSKWNDLVNGNTLTGQSGVRRGDTIIFYVSTHGQEPPIGHSPSGDLMLGSGDPGLDAAYTLRIEDIAGYLRMPQLVDVRKIVILDSCYSGDAAQNLIAMANNTGITNLGVLAASLPGQGATSGYDGTGIFTKVLARVMAPDSFGYAKADANDDGILSLSELSSYIRKDSRTLTYVGQDIPLRGDGTAIFTGIDASVLCTSDFVDGLDLSVPEPSDLIMLTMGMLSLVKRRHTRS